MKRVWVGAVVLAALVLYTAGALADVCMPCAQATADPNLHGRSLKSYWKVGKGGTSAADPLVLAKAFEQGHLALCGAADNWEWNMFTAMVASELGKSMFASSSDSLRAQAKEKFQLSGCYFAQALKNATKPQDQDKIRNSAEYYWAAHYNEALNFFKENALDQALERLELALLITPNECKIHGVLGPTLNKLQRYEEAIATLEKGRSLCPDDTVLTVNLFAALYNRASAVYNQAVSAENDTAAQRRFYGEALSWYQKAGEMRPDDLNNVYRIGMTQALLAEMGDASHAEGARKNLKAYADKTDNKEEKANALNQLTRLEIGAKNWDQAQAYAEEYLPLAPRDPEAYWFRATIAQEKKDADTAAGYLVFYTAMAKGQPGGAPASGGDLGKVIQEKGQPDELKLYKDDSGKSMVAAFYWSKGEGYAFYDGSKRGSVTFPAPSP